METHSLLSDDSIEAWIAENEPNGAEKLWRRYQLGELGNVRGKYVSIWFDKQEAYARAAKEAAADLLAERDVQAAERSAAATEDAAASARASARWAALAALISLAALFLSAWPYIPK